MMVVSRRSLVVGLGRSSLVVLMGFGAATHALAQGSKLPARNDTPHWTACEQERLLGNVKSVTVWSGGVDHVTGEPRGNKVRDSQIEFSDDGRVATETSAYGFESSSEVYEFDSSDRLLTHTLLLNGSPFETVRCSYDSEGRLLSSIGTRPGGASGGISYAYGDGTRSIRVFGVKPPATIVQESFDGDGRILLSTGRTESTGALESEVRFNYFADTRQECVSVPGRPTSCVTLKFDAHGREVERRTDGFVSAGRFEYDTAGNWVKHVTYDLGDASRTIDSATWREIAYRH